MLIVTPKFYFCSLGLAVLGMACSLGVSMKVFPPLLWLSSLPVQNWNSIFPLSQIHRIWLQYGAVYWHCDDVVRETRISAMHLHSAMFFLLVLRVLLSV